MKKLFALILTLALALSCMPALAAQVDYTKYTQWPVSSEEIPVSIYIYRDDAYGCDAKDMWFWKYFSEKSGLDFSIEQISASARDERKSLMFASGDLPDVVYGISISAGEFVQYGSEEGLMLDLTPYINPDVMPNLCRILEDYPEALSYCTCVDGKIYTLPSFAATKDGETARSFIDYDLLQELGRSVPTTLDELIETLYAIKEYDPEMIPLGGSQSAYNPSYYILNALGYLGAAYNDGTGVTVRDGHAVIPATDETFKVFLEIMSGFYADGIITEDFYTIDSTTVNAQMAEGKLGLYPYVPYTVTPAYEDFSHWESVIPLTSEYNDTPRWTASNPIRIGYFAMSADCENPEAILRAFDGFYSMEMSISTWYGPMYEDGLGGWMVDENCAKRYLDANGNDYEVGLQFCYQMGSGLQYAVGIINYLDSFNFECADKKNAQQYLMASLWGNDGAALKFYDDENGDGNFRNSMKENISPYETKGYPSVVYMTLEETSWISESMSILAPFMKTEIAKFITGARDLAEFDDYLAECRKLGSDEVNSLYDSYYQIYLASLK